MHAILPVKDLVLAKSRLSGALAPHERRSLNQAMLEDVLEVLSSHPDVDVVLVVSDDPSAKLLAEKYSAELFSEREAGVRGLNGALKAACNQLAAQAVDGVLIVHSDMPLLEPEDLDAILERGHGVPGGVVLGPDSKDDGTNAMLLSAQNPPKFHYGDGSFGLHIAAARQLGLQHTVIRRPGIGFDVDTVADLFVAIDASTSNTFGPRTAEFLSRDEIAERLSLLRTTGLGSDGKSEVCSG